jgi:two-component system, OmpR family, phosphate regulon sensor histidine kinase PhoR
VQDQSLKALAALEFQTTLLGIIGHDLRQSLHVIQGTYTLLRSRLENVPQQAWLDRGERAVTKLTEQLDYLVDERANALGVSSVGLGPLFWRLLLDNEDFAIQRGIDLRAVATNGRVLSNPVLLGMYSPQFVDQCHTVHEAGRAHSDRLSAQRVRNQGDVYDTGIGIPQYQLPRIFDSFTRLTPACSNGLGIGLSIVRRALEVLGHRIEVRSVVGEGSLFSIYAPAETKAKPFLRLDF